MYTYYLPMIPERKIECTSISDLIEFLVNAVEYWRFKLLFGDLELVFGNY